jgi:carboxyl-terminal processing protease
MRRTRPRPLHLLAALLPVLLVVGIWMGGHPDTLPGFVRGALVADTDAQAYDEAIDVLAHDYYRPVDRRALLDKSLGGAVKSLDDRFSNYFSPSEYQKFQQATNGRFEGVGMTVEEVDRGLRVISVYDGSPAANGGLRPGDTITAVNGRPIKGLSSAESTTRIKGPAGTSVTVTIERAGATRQLRLQRAEVDIPIVQSAMKRAGGRKEAWVELSSFTSGAHGKVGEAVRNLLSQGAEGVVLDLRDNGGGLLNEAVLVSSIFLPDGKVVTTKGRNRATRVYSATGGAISPKIPVTVLVDENTASASEIVTGALQDRHRATVVGTHTFGKGVFQEIEPLTNGGALDITVGEYFLPSGRNLGGGGVKQGAGIQPDVKIQDDRATKADEQLQQALDLLAAKR